MKSLMKFFLLGVLLILPVCLSSCGGGTSSSNENYSGSSESISQYNGKWEVFSPMDKPGSSETFRLTLRGSHSAEIKYWETGFGYDNIIAEGSGEAYLNGNSIIVELTKGQSRGMSFEFKIRNGVITLPDGTSLSKSY